MKQHPTVLFRAVSSDAVRVPSASSRSSRARIALALSPLMLLIAGCSTGATVEVPQESTLSAPAAENDAAPSGPESTSTATFEVNGQTFSIDLESCMVTADGDILLHGPASEPGAEVIGYFDGDVAPYGDTVVGEFRLDMGAAGQFESSDTFIAMGDSLGGNLEITADGEGWLVMAPAWSDDGTVLGQATVRFTC